MENGEEKIDASRLTCFNTGGIDPYGKTFEKRVDLKHDHVQPLWIGVDIPKHPKPGTYSGSIVLKSDNSPDQTVDLHLTIENSILTDRGDSEPWRHSRLRWLNSTRGIDNKPVNRYQSIHQIDERNFELSGKKLSLTKDFLPGSIEIFGKEILENPVSFVVESNQNHIRFSPAENHQILTEASGLHSTSWENHSDHILLSSVGTVEADGYIHYRIVLRAKKDIDLKDVRLEIPMRKALASYMMGMGLPGTKIPQEHIAKWEGPHDSFWFGSEDGGLWCELRGSNYHGPLLNLYQPAYPASWYNENKGGFQIEQSDNEVKAVVYSGKRAMKAGDEIAFEWAFLMTPVKKVNYKSQFLNRYYHNWLDPAPSKEDQARGIKIINVHHANKFNPHINYPFIAVDEMKHFISEMHQHGQKVKIYYTIRELSNYATELWALRSLGNEIFGDGKGGGYPWLREHLVDGYRPQWYQYFPDKSADASIVNAPGDSRWYNYYIEGLAWLVNHADIDGLYLDDVTYDRRILKRIRKVLDNQKPGCLLDLHSNTGFSKGPALQYAEFFPYIDKIWFGESFMYDQMPPENWLVEVSGIPFGHMGDMLHRGGNRWLGMLFGMTVRHPWLTDGVTCDPRPVWEIWDTFGIHEAKMAGFWEENCLVKTHNSNVKATTYLRNGKLLIALGNFSDELQHVTLFIDWEGSGIKRSDARLIGPGIKDFQPASEFSTGTIHSC